MSPEEQERWLARFELMVKVAVEAEREACALLAMTSQPAFEVAKLIRARGKK